MTQSRRRRIAVVPGDGIGVEVIAEQKKLLAVINERRSLGLELVDMDWGAERWLREKVGLPKGALDDLSANYDAITFGALGDPRIPDMAHGREILLGMRQGLDLYANMRPIRCLDDSLSPLKGKGENRSTSCASAKTPRTCMCPWAASSSRAPTTRSPKTSASTPERASSGCSGRPLSTRARAGARRS